MFVFEIKQTNCRRIDQHKKGNLKLWRKACKVKPRFCDRIAACHPSVTSFPLPQFPSVTIYSVHQVHRCRTATETRTLKPSPAALPGAWAGSWIGGGAAGTWIGAAMWDASIASGSLMCYSTMLAPSSRHAWWSSRKQVYSAGSDDGTAIWEGEPPHL